MLWHVTDSTSQLGIVHFPHKMRLVQNFWKSLEVSFFTARRGEIWQGVYFVKVFAVNLNVNMKLQTLTASLFGFHVSTSSPCCNFFFLKVSTVLRPKLCWQAAGRTPTGPWTYHPTPPHPNPWTYHQRKMYMTLTCPTPPHPPTENLWKSRGR